MSADERPEVATKARPRLVRLIAEAEGYVEVMRRRPAPQLARAKTLARHVGEVERQLVALHWRMRRLERALLLERRARKYAVQLLNARRTPAHANGTMPLPEDRDVQ